MLLEVENFGGAGTNEEVPSSSGIGFMVPGTTPHSKLQRSTVPLESGHEGATDEDKQMVMDRSLQDASEQESAHVAEALLRSKADATVLNGDGIVVLRLTRMARSPQVTATLLESPALAECRARVTEAGCELMPSWAGGVMLLVPLTPEHLIEFEELGVELQAHHIVSLARDMEHVKAALQALPHRRRPRITAEPPADGTMCISEHNVSKQQGHTGISFGSAAHGEPCGGNDHEDGSGSGDGFEDANEIMVEVEVFVPTNSSLAPPSL